MTAFIDVWYGGAFGLDDHQQAEWILPAEEIRHLRSITHPDVFERQLNSRVRLRQVLAQYINNNAIEIQRNEYGKPFLKGHSLYFNLSHSGDRLAIAVTNSGDLGLDIEHVRARKGFSGLARRCFALEEFEYWNSLADEWARMQQFYRFWTRKEALVKAIGRGIALGLEQCVVEPLLQAHFLHVPEKAPTDWRLFALEPEQDYCGAVVLESSSLIESINWRQWAEL